MYGLKHSIVFFIISFLFACASPPLSPSNDEQKPLAIAPNKKQLATVSSWTLTGAIAAKNKQHAWSAMVNWQQQGHQHYTIRLLGPLGGGSVLIEKKGKMITYQDGSKQSSSTNAEELLLKQTGIRLPVPYLYYWVRGLAAPTAIQSVTYDSNHRLSALNQSGFSLLYQQYTTINQMSLPSKILLEGHGMKIKMVIKRWVI